MRLDNAYIVDKDTPIKTLRNQDGFTLIEVLVALTIFSVGLLAIAAMQNSAIRVNSTSAQLTQRSTWSIDRLEDLMSLPYTDPWLEAAGNPPGGLDSLNRPHQITSPDGVYSISWIIADNTPTANTKQITMTVTGKGKTLRLTSIRAQSL